MERWASDLVDSFKQKKIDKSELLIAVISSISPFKFKIGDEEVSRNIIVNTNLQYRKNDLLAKFNDKPVQSEWFDFLKDFYMNFVLNVGDMVVIMRSGTKFYVLAKL